MRKNWEVLLKIHKLNIILALILLSAITLLFLHSELGFLACHNDSHSEHDYSLLVRSTTVVSDVHQNFESVSVSFNNIFLHVCLFDSLNLLANNICLNNEKPINLKIPPKTYLKTKILLI
jgi:hypothetical protein